MPKKTLPNLIQPRTHVWRDEKRKSQLGTLCGLGVPRYPHVRAAGTGMRADQPTCLRCQRVLRAMQRDADAEAAKHAGITIEVIARLLGVGVGTVRKYLRVAGYSRG